jgi:hypothetical protein
MIYFNKLKLFSDAGIILFLENVPGNTRDKIGARR